MKVFQPRFALLAVAGVLAIAAAVSTVNAETIVPAGEIAPTAHQEAAEGATHDIVAPALWMVAGVTAGGLVLGVFYLFKRRVGGFPENPSWVAPISVMRSSTFPVEGDYDDDTATNGHAPAH